MSDLLIFDDGRGEFGPLTEMRPASALRTGGVTNLERIERTLGRFASGFLVPDSLAGPLHARVSVPVNTPGDNAAMCVNARWWGIGGLPELETGQAAMIGDEILVAVLDPADLHSFASSRSLPDHIDCGEVEGTLYRRPWDILDHLSDALSVDLDATSLPTKFAKRADVVGEHLVHMAESVVVFPSVVLDATEGRIVVEAEAILRPGAVLCGPCWIGRGSTVAEGAVIRANTVIGPGCKVGGEVGASILQGWSNKAHDGYLGDSILGEWVNLGAGTTSSNLLNTYGETSVRLQPGSARERTGRAFCGSFIGDHVKTAIGTLLMTGTSIGTGSMIACSSYAPTTVGPLRWVTDAGEKPYRIERFLDMTAAMMARRNRELDPADEARLRELAAAPS
jgi:UDP-N-acetylglucosamine diphosphorylase/glucosamine-1-phosphate N-acetyltransferase